MRKVMIGIATLAAGVAAVRIGPPLAKRGMAKCHEMMAGMQRSGDQSCVCHQEPLQAATV